MTHADLEPNQDQAVSTVCSGDDLVQVGGNPNRDPNSTNLDSWYDLLAVLRNRSFARLFGLGLVTLLLEVSVSPGTFSRG